MDSNISESFNNIEQADQKRKNELLVLICGIALVIGGVGATFSLVSICLGIYSLASNLNSFISFGVYYICFRLAKQGRYKLVSRVMASLATLSITILYCAVGTMLPLLIFMLPVALAIVLLDSKWVIGVSGFLIAVALGVIITQHFLGVYAPTVDPVTLGPMYLFFMLAIFPGVIALLWLPARSQSQALTLQNRQLVLALNELQSRHTHNQAIAEQILVLAEQLRHFAHKQTSSSNGQVDLIAQLNTSAIELSSVSSQIASSAQYFNETIEAVTHQTKTIRHTSSLASNESRAGLDTMKQTIEAGNEFKQMYERLVENLEELAGKSTNMRLILALLTDLAHHTHLLALNATIEAAGAGEYGERFRVVAHEVTQLAARSSQANNQVVGIISQLEEGINQSVNLVQQVLTKAQVMDQSFKKVSVVLEGMQRVVEETEGQAQLINQRMQGASDQIGAIKAATLQQESASQQIVEALEILNEKAQEGAQDSVLVFNSATTLEDTSKELEQGLVLVSNRRA